MRGGGLEFLLIEYFLPPQGKKLGGDELQTNFVNVSLKNGKIIFCRMSSLLCTLPFSDLLWSTHFL